MRHTLDARPMAAAQRLRVLALLVGVLGLLAALIAPLASAAPKATKADHHPMHHARHPGDRGHAHRTYANRYADERPEGDHRDAHRRPRAHQDECDGYRCGAAPECGDDSGYGKGDEPGDGKTAGSDYGPTA